MDEEEKALYTPDLRARVSADMQALSRRWRSTPVDQAMAVEVEFAAPHTRTSGRSEAAAQRRP